MRTKSNGIVSKSIPYIYFFLSLGLALYYQKNGLGNDFRTFYSAGKAIDHGLNPWDVNKGNEFSAFLNGPITAILLGGVALLPYNAALFAIRIASLMCLPHLIKFLAEALNFRIDREYRHLFAIGALFTFPVRANLEYGQLAILFFTILFLALKRVLTESNYLNHFLLGVGIYIVLDYKPHVFVPIAILLFWKRKGLISGFGSTLLAALIISIFSTGKFPLYAWLEAIFSRGTNSSSNAEQMSLYAILGLSQIISWLIAVMILIYISKKFIFHFNQYDILQATVLLITWLTLIPFSHPTDLITVILFPIFLRYARVTHEKIVIFFAAGMAIVWSNNLVFSTVVTIPIFIIFSFLTQLRIGERIFAYIALLLPQVIFLSIIHESPNAENITRRILNFSAVLLCVIVTRQFTSRDLESMS